MRSMSRVREAASILSSQWPISLITSFANAEKERDISKAGTYNRKNDEDIVYAEGFDHEHSDIKAQGNEKEGQKVESADDADDSASIALLRVSGREHWLLSRVHDDRLAWGRVPSVKEEPSQDRSKLFPLLREGGFRWGRPGI